MKLKPVTVKYDVQVIERIENIRKASGVKRSSDIYRAIALVGLELCEEEVLINGREMLFTPLGKFKFIENEKEVAE